MGPLLTVKPALLEVPVLLELILPKSATPFLTASITLPALLVHCSCVQRALLRRASGGLLWGCTGSVAGL